MTEAGAVINKQGEPIHWHLPAGRTAGSLPDSRTLWDVLWQNRRELWGVAHSHPGGGVPSPSHTDITTFAAIEAALGRRLHWWISSSTDLSVCLWTGFGVHDYGTIHLGNLRTPNFPTWAKDLIRISEENDNGRHPGN